MTELLFTVAQAVPVPVTQPGAAAPAAGGAPAAGTTATVGAAPKAAAGQPDTSSMISSFALPVLMIVVFYFLLIRPQQKREKDRQKQLKALEKGDRVLTRGGIFGTVVGVKAEDNIAIVKISDDVKVEVAISTLDTVVTKTSGN